MFISSPRIGKTSALLIWRTARIRFTENTIAGAKVGDTKHDAMGAGIISNSRPSQKSDEDVRLGFGGSVQNEDRQKSTGVAGVGEEGGFMKVEAQTFQP